MKKLIFIPMIFACYLGMGQGRSIVEQKRKQNELYEKGIEQAKKDYESTKLKISNGQLVNAKIVKPNMDAIGYNKVPQTNIKLAKIDLPGTFNWYEAKEVCNLLGNGWRLPAKKEFAFLFMGIMSDTHLSEFAVNLEGIYWTDNAESGDTEFPLYLSWRNGIIDASIVEPSAKRQSKNLKFKVRLIKN